MVIPNGPANLYLRQSRMSTLGFINQVSQWWEALTSAGQLFYGIGLAAGAVSLVLALLAFVGMEHHDAVDAVGAADVDHGGGGIFSIKPLTGFFLGFGWAGGLAIDNGWPLPAAIGLALLAGGIVMAAVVLMFRTIYAMRSDGTVRVSDTLGAVGTVYVTLPARKAPGGQVIVNFSGRQETLAALSDAERPIASGEKVKVISVIDGRTVLVEAL